MSISIKKDIGNRVRQIRGKMNLTQAQLGDQLKITAAAVSSCELGDSGISVYVAIRLSDLSGISLDYLLKGRGGGVTLLQEELPPEERALLENFRRANRKDQAALIRFAQAVSRED